MIRNMSRGVPSLFKEGTRHLSGKEAAIMKNIEACKNLAEITRTSLGPNGMNKMVINHLDRLFVTSDAATIIKEMEVVHPAAKMVVMAAQMQEVEIGDGSNFVIVLAGELLAQAESLLRMGLHPSEIVAGYDKAGKKALEILPTLVSRTVEKKEMNTKEVLAGSIKTAVGSKFSGEEDFIAGLVAEACLEVMPEDPTYFNVSNVRVAKILGGNLHQSHVINGMVITTPPEGLVKSVKNAKVAIYTCSIDTQATETKGTVLIENADDLMNYNLGEEKKMEEHIRDMAKNGVTVAVTGSTVGEMALHFLNKYNIMAVRVPSKFDLRRLCQCTKSRPLVQLSPLRADDLGFCSEVVTKEIGGTRVVIFSQQQRESRISTILIRASTENIMNDVERAIDDGVNVIRGMGKDGRFVPGAGATEIELARRLQSFGESSAGLDQYAIKKFAEAFEVIPRTLAQNSGMKDIDIISKLYAAHERGDTNVGVDIDECTIGDMTKRGVHDLLATKLMAMRLITDVAVTILRVDQLIAAKAAGGPKMPKNQGHWDDD